MLIGGRAIYDMVEYDLKPQMLGRDSDCIESLWYIRGRKPGIPLYKLWP